MKRDTHMRPHPLAHPPCSPCFHQRGTTLIEALVAMVVLSIGLLGMVGLQSNALKLNQTSMQRSQATILAYAILDQMRSDSAAAKSGDYDMESTACSDELHETPPADRTPPQNWICEIRNTLSASAKGGICRIAAPDDTVCANEASDEFFRISMQWNEAEIKDASGNTTLADRTQTLTIVGRL